MNLYAVRAIYLFEMHRTWRTLLQSIASPVISTSLYFVVFGSAIGSRMVAIDGISLTVAKLRKRGFAVWIIPHTRKMTNLHTRKVGDAVNIETDLLGKYVLRQVRESV